MICRIGLLLLSITTSQAAFQIPSGEQPPEVYGAPIFQPGPGETLLDRIAQFNERLRQLRNGMHVPHPMIHPPGRPPFHSNFRPHPGAHGTGPFGRTPPKPVVQDVHLNSITHVYSIMEFLFLVIVVGGVASMYYMHRGRQTAVLVSSTKGYAPVVSVEMGAQYTNYGSMGQ